MPEDQDDKQTGGSAEHTHARTLLESKWLGKQLGRVIEVYCNRAPRVEGVLTAVDERFGRIVLDTQAEEVIVWLGNVNQIRIPHENNGHPKSAGGKK